MDEKMRLDRVLANMGYGSRTEIKKMIKKGLVTVEGAAVKDPAVKINPWHNNICVGTELVRYQKYVYFLLNKPAGYVSATEDPRERTVLDLLAPEDKIFAPFPVGRLDKDTEGLLLLTNDGRLGHYLTSPRHKVPKTYYALVKGEVTARDVEAFREGVVLDDGYQTLPAELKVLRCGQRSEAEVVIQEGKYHQVKRMFAARGQEVIYLRRLSMGPLILPESLAPGEYRPLSPEELDRLQEGAED